MRCGFPTVLLTSTRPDRRPTGTSSVTRACLRVGDGMEKTFGILAGLSRFLVRRSKTSEEQEERLAYGTSRRFESAPARPRHRQVLRQRCGGRGDRGASRLDAGDGVRFRSRPLFRQAPPDRAAGASLRSTPAGRRIILTYLQPQRVSNLRFSVTLDEYRLPRIVGTNARYPACRLRASI